MAQQHPAKKRKEKNRYEVEPGQRGPDKIEETPEVRPDLPEVSAEKGESLPEDTAYAGMVSKYFNEKRSVTDVTEAQDTQYFDHDAFLSMQQQSLEKMANPEAAARMDPKDVSAALGDLAGTMAKRNPDVPMNLTGDARADANSEQEHLAARAIFMEAGKKVFPNVEVHPDEFESDLARTARQLSEAVDAQDVPNLDEEEIERLRASDPKALAKKIDAILFQAGDLMQTRSRMNFDLGDPRRKEEANGHLAAGTEMFYKLQLYRDELQKEMFGRTDTLKSEENEIERIRARLLGETESDEEEERQELSPEDKGMLGDLDAMMKREKEAELKAEAAGEPFARKNQPTIDALRAVWKEDGDLARRLRSFEGRIGEMAKQRLARMEPPNGDLAYSLASKEMFRQLAPGERAHLEKAAEEEASRRKEPILDGDGRAKAAERLFTEFVRELIDDRG